MRIHGLIPAHAGKTAYPARPPAKRGAHPRSRGENPPRKTRIPTSSGSSPLTRGKRCGWYCVRVVGGLIPAHAGKTTACEPMRITQAAHPRSRGENMFLGRVRRYPRGSSPLTRGKPHGRPPTKLSFGLIPAHAGKTRASSAAGSRPQAHPRSRGENEAAPRQRRSLAGSSPLTRGKRTHPSDKPVRGGLIPAHAGKTQRTPRSDLAGRAHPRSRGENPAHLSKPARPGGSSPLTRGKPIFSLSRLVFMLAHPRSRGENREWIEQTREGRGSSPLTRGKPRLDETGLHRGGLIPAHAGKTLAMFCTQRLRRAHPRSRGENPISHSGATVTSGSSPLTRGKHFLTCAFIAQIDQILESLELCAFSESYSSQDVYATDAPRDRVRSIGLAPRSSRGAS